MVNSLMNWWTDIGEDAARRMIGAKRESMIGALEMLRGEFGGAEGYFRERCGFSGEEIERIRGYLVVDEKAVCGVW